MGSSRGKISLFQIVPGHSLILPSKAPQSQPPNFCFNLFPSVAAPIIPPFNLQKSSQSYQEDVRQADIEPPVSSPLGLRSLVAGAVGGVCSVFAGYPFDMVKVRRQTAQIGVYSGSIDALRQAVRKDGLVRGLYTGVSVPLMGVTPMYAVSFWGYDLGKSLVRFFSSDGSPNKDLTIAQTYAAGFFSAIPMNLVSAPFERVKILLQTQGQKTLKHGNNRKYSGGFDVVRQLYRQGGIRSVYKGAALTFARDGPDSAAYFATYEYCKKKLTPKDAEGKDGPLSLLAVGVSGAAAGLMMIIPLFPIDTVKSRLQKAGGKLAIKGIIRDVYKNRGLKGFYPGVGPALARAVPACAATTLGWELTHEAMNKRFGLQDGR